MSESWPARPHTQMGSSPLTCPLLASEQGAGDMELVESEKNGHRGATLLSISAFNCDSNGQ
jgi:hypothetical protein